MGIVTDAQGVADKLIAAGIVATIDPARAAALGVCVLVPPPVIDYTNLSTVYRLACLSNRPAGTLEALEQLDGLVQALNDVPRIYPERAEPSAYVLAAGEAPRPAYIVTITT